jgi:ribonucleotide monophosphatase NagD (HAD superfamily)
VDNYDAFILDQFGVLHNGVEALDGARELCEYLVYDQKKQLVILSNTSAPSDKALDKLEKLGFSKQLFVGAVTSGEEAARYIRQKYASTKTTKALMFTWDASDLKNPRLTAMPRAFLEKCGPNVQVATSVEEADWILLHGSEVWHRGDNLEDVPLGTFIENGSTDLIVDPILHKCIKRNLPVVCANPDFVVQTPSGGTAYMPGKIAQRYKELGGDVLLFGKPQVEHFQACLRVLGLPAERVAHVGDSLHHDIDGANRAGIPNVLVTSGIHMQELQVSFGQMPDESVLEHLFEEQGNIVPTHVVSAFRL